jgi:hypothetical protein
MRLVYTVAAYGYALFRDGEGKPQATPPLQNKNGTNRRVRFM